MNFRCPQCGAVGHAADSLVGKKIECNCGCSFPASRENAIPEPPKLALYLQAAGFITLILGVAVGIFGAMMGASSAILLWIPLGIFCSLQWFFFGAVVRYLSEIAYRIR